MAQIEQRAAIVGFFLAFVIADYARLEGTGLADGVSLGFRVPVNDRGAVFFSPFKEFGICN